MSRTQSQAAARARANIALAKYWGKSDLHLNVPAVPSISMTLDRLVTNTTVRFDPALGSDRLWLDGKLVTGVPLCRASLLLDRVRERAAFDTHAEVKSQNRFPTAAGLAWSASAARSVYGGFVELPHKGGGKAGPAAKQICTEDHWDLCLIVVLTAKGPKAIGSTEGMELSRRTSPLYGAWIEAAPKLTARIRRALKSRDLPALGRAMEQSTMSFHSCALTSDPPVVYFQPATVAVLHAIRRLRDERGIEVYATMDAGPHVKSLCSARDAALVQRTLRRTEGVLGTLVARAGAGVELLG